jgi:hypothetical protein
MIPRCRRSIMTILKLARFETSLSRAVGSCELQWTAEGWGVSMISLRSPAKCIFAAVLALGICVFNGAMAADIAMPTKAPPIEPAPVIDTWTFRFTPYIWATSLNGFTTVKGYTTDIDASFIDILDHTQFPSDLFQLAAFGEARYGRFAVLTDIAYMKMGLGASLTTSHDIGRLATLGIGASAGLTVKMIIAEAAAAYEVAHWGTGVLPDSGTALDLYAGGRVWWQQADADFNISGTLTGLGPLGLTRTDAGTVSASGDVSWIDPVIGARLRHQLAPGWNLMVSGDVGGFGVGSKFSWQAIGALNFDFLRTANVSWSGMIGYKALYVDYAQGSGLTQYEYSMTMYGPIFGITARF